MNPQVLTKPQQSIHADIAYTLADYIRQKLLGKSKDFGMNITNLIVHKGLVANANRKKPQLIRVTATTTDVHSGVLDLIWQNVDDLSHAQEPFATANVILGSNDEWLSSWSPIAHLITSRIAALEKLAADGKASRLSHNMAYTLFASNLVDYAEKYRGMQSVVMSELEGFADVQLTTKESGVWTVPPYFIDSVAHLAGFIMNCSDAIDTKNNYCVTPGWKSMRFAKPFVAGAKYRSYVRMIPTEEDPSVYFGDVYIMQDGIIIGMVGGIQFRRFPRILLSRFFSPPDKMATMEDKQSAVAAPAQTPAPAKPPVTILTDKKEAIVQAAIEKPAPTEPAASVPAGKADSVASKALLLIANEAGLDLTDLEDDASFSDLGVDSLMSLVIVEKFKIELDVKVGGSLFLDYPTIGDLRKWLEEYYG